MTRVPTFDGAILVVSPHFDDAALSCSVLLDRREPVTLLQVCTAGPVPAVVSDWDRRAGVADSDDAGRARRAEERAAFAGSPHEMREVGLLDAQYGAIFDLDAQTRVREAILEWADATHGPRTVVVPVGAGCAPRALVPFARARAAVSRYQVFWMHPDHVAVRDACVEALVDRTDIAVVLYEEFPYRLTRRGDGAARRVVRRFGASARAVRVDAPVDRAAKAQRLAAYATQLPLLLPVRARTVEGLTRHLPGDERYWYVRRADRALGTDDGARASGAWLGAGA